MVWRTGWLGIEGSRYPPRRRVMFGVDQMLGRDPEQHRPPRISWETLIDRLAEAGIQRPNSS